MRKFLMAVLCAGLLSVNGAFAIRYEAPNGGNASFYPLMQHQLEQQETLDFSTNPEGYKQKRDAKDAVRGTIVRSNTYNQNYTPNYGITNTQPSTHPVNNMFFTKDANGNIRIQGINSLRYSNTIDSTVKSAE